ncbi:VapE domain-containing protein [Parasphingorhabdus flavimaris]|uniref:VapE domain-containing protein n=1 Tax=Parasphingorhabdus flavimaris TaxID=266812 RepID=UPI003002038D
MTTVINQTQIPPSAGASAPPLTKISLSARGQAALDQAHALANAGHAAYTTARDNPKSSFEILLKMGFKMSFGAPARKALALHWSEPCCQTEWDAANLEPKWCAIHWEKDHEFYDWGLGKKVSYKAGDVRPQSLLPPAFPPFTTPLILMTDDDFGLDVDFPEELGLQLPETFASYEDLAGILRAHTGFRMLWDNMEATSSGSAMTWLQGCIVQKTGQKGYSLIMRKATGDGLGQGTGFLAAQWDGPLPVDVAETERRSFVCTVDTRDAGAGLLYGPGTVVAIDEKAANRGELVPTERYYRMVAGGQLTRDTLAYLPASASAFVLSTSASKSDAGRPGDTKARRDVSGLECLGEAPSHGILSDGQSSLVDGIDIPIIRDPQQVKEQLVHSINAFVVERTAMAAQAANAAQGIPAGEPIVRNAPEYERHEEWRDHVMFPLTGSVAFGEFGSDTAKAEEIGKSIMDTATQMFAAAGVNTGNNDEQWDKALADAQSKVAAGDHRFLRAGHIEKDAKACGWVAPAIAPSALIQQPAANPAQVAPPAPAQAAAPAACGASPTGRVKRVLSTAAPKFAPASGTPNWAVSVTRKDPFTKATVQVPVPSEATAAQAASYMGISGRFNELDGECEVIIPASTDLAGMEVGVSRLSKAVGRSVAVAAQLKHGTRFGVNIMHDALEMMCEERPMNPVVDYLESCQMVEGVTCDQLFRKYANVIIGGEYPEAVDPVNGLTESQLADIQSELTMVAMVGRAYDPGGEFQQVPVLVSHGQGVGKSDMWKTLVPVKVWHGDTPVFGLSPKEIAESTKGKWVHENAEMQGFSKSAAEDLKGLTSRTGDQARGAYEKGTSRNLRRWLLVCTSNIQFFLFDPSGDRRYWPWLVEKVDVAGIRRDRDALWAHAVHLFKTKYQGDADLVRLDPAFYRLTDMVREKFTVANPKEDTLEDGASIGPSGNVPIEGRVLQDHTGDYLWMPSTALYKIIIGRNARLTNGGSGEVSDLLRRRGWKSRKFNGRRGWHRLLTADEKLAHDRLNAQTTAAQQMAGGSNVIPMVPPKPATAPAATPATTPAAPGQTNPAGPSGTVTP